jgi:uncharacterized protein (TIGR00661 family)
MRILYGVTGEGMGHATRSKVILEHLVSRHDVQIVVSGRAHQFLTRAFPQLQVHEIAGLTMVYEDNRVRKSKTAWQLIKSIAGFTENVEVMERIWESFRPELCIADFDSCAYLFARQYRLPVLSIDNMQVINRCKLEVDVPPDEATSYRLAKTIVKGKLPRCDHYLVTSFFFPPVRKKRTSLYPPILRQAILEARQDATRPQDGHVLVYQTSDTFTELVPTLQRLGQRFVVYGLKRNEELGNVTLKDFSEAGFVHDLRTARAVLAGGGFSLMGEAVYLGKPMLSVPLQGQFEQTCNALYLQHLGYGEYHRELSEAGITSFLGHSDEYAKNLARYRQQGNQLILRSLDELIEEIGDKGRLV